MTKYKFIPNWAAEFIETKVVPSDRSVHVPKLDEFDQDEADTQRRYNEALYSAKKHLQRQKAATAVTLIGAAAPKHGTPMYHAICQRLLDIDDEFVRISVEGRSGRPYHLKEFPPVVEKPRRADEDADLFTRPAVSPDEFIEEML